MVSGAEVQDRDGGRLVAHAVRLFGPSLPRLALVWADAAYGGAFVEELREQFGWTLEIVKRSQEPQERGGFRVQPHRWIVERLFAWLGNFRRLVVRYERHALNYLGFVQLGCILILLRQG
jgi:putative transposase